jgi:hypothetical protein
MPAQLVENVGFLERRRHANAAALDSPSNVAARVLSIIPRFIRLKSELYCECYGREMLEKAEAIHALLDDPPARFWTDDTNDNRSQAAEYLAKKERAGLLGALASIIQKPSTPAQVLTEELDEIDRARKLRQPAQIAVAGPAEAADPVQRAIDRRLAGLAFSGGGIRSATFNLGVLQALADAGLLGHVDYLSTVSGGGYIGTWLESWIQHRSDTEVERDLAPARAPASQTEPDPIQFLRSYSNYLTPEKGMFSADTWTMLTIWMRNTFLNLIVLIFTGACVLLVPRLIGKAAKWGSENSLNYEVVGSTPTSPLSLVALVLLLLATVLIGLNLRRAGRGTGAGPAWYQRQHWVLLLIVVPTLVASMIASFCLWDYLSDLLDIDPGTSFPWTDPKLVVPAGFVFFLLLVTQITGDFWNCFLRDKSQRRLAKFSSAPLLFVLYPLFCSFAFWGTLVLIGRWMWSWGLDGGIWHALSFGTPLLLTAFALTMTIEIGLMGRSFPDDRREWMGRLGAWVSITSLGVLALFAAALYGPGAMAWAVSRGGSWLAGILPAGWLAATFGALKAAKQPPAKVGEQPRKPSLMNKVLITVGPYVFVVGLLLLLTCALNFALSPGACGSGDINATLTEYCRAGTPFVSADLLWRARWDVINYVSVWWLLGAFAVSAFIALLFSRTVDINEFSMHHFYKNRLVRCYLGACRSDKRKPNPFTGFDENDERRLCTLRHDLRFSTPDGDEGPYYGPYPIINATLNLVKGERLSWQERKGSSFVFTPKYSGWNKETNQKGSWVNTATYRTTNVYAYPNNDKSEGGIGLGTAMAISGAAVSPSMGYQSTGPLAFLMTVFNVRLGWWLGNPLLDAWLESGPGWGLNYLLTELFGLTNDRRKYVYLSDGGHFETLGIYELVRRRCLIILACDAEQDGDMTFGGLGNAIRKCRTDFGVEIEIDVTRLRKDPSTGFSQEHCAVGTIRYPETNGSGPVTGTLVYLKSSITGDEPTDVLEYRSHDAAFPHQTTADQFFDESQFESYRKLGYHVGAVELHPGKLVLLYAESVARLDEERRKKFESYRSTIGQLIDGTNGIQPASLKEHIRPLIGRLLARPGQPLKTQRAAGVSSDQKILDYYASLLDFMVEAIKGEEHKMAWEGQHAALLALFDHWSRLEGFAGQFGILGNKLDAATRAFFQERLEL